MGSLWTILSYKNLPSSPSEIQDQLEAWPIFISASYWPWSIPRAYRD